MPDQQVRPNSQRLTDEDARHYLSEGLVRCKGGPARIALAAGCDEKTIRRARDGEHTLGLSYTFNLLDHDPHALDFLLAAKGYMLVAATTTGSGDIIPAAGAAIHRIGTNRAEHSPAGTIETDIELINSEAENDALLAACLERRARITAAKLKLAAVRP